MSSANRIIEFFGMPRTGKTTLLDELTRRLGAAIDVRRFTERDTPFHDRDTPYDFNVRLRARLQTFMAANSANSGSVLLLDRGFHDQRVWPEVHFRLGSYSEAQHLEQLQGVLIPPGDYQEVLFLAPPPVSLARHRDEGYGADRHCMNLEHLQVLYEEYQRYARRFGVRTVDASQPIDRLGRNVLELLHT